MVVSLVNNEQDTVKEKLKLETKLPKLTYGLLQTVFSVTNEGSFWTSSDIVLTIKLRAKFLLVTSHYLLVASYCPVVTSHWLL